MSPSELTVYLIVAALLCSTSISASPSINSVIPPADNAIPVCPSLVSLSIEQDRWTDWSGTTSQNQLFYNVMQNLKNLTGVPPGIRIGANSDDHTDFDKNVPYARATLLSQIQRRRTLRLPALLSEMATILLCNIFRQAVHIHTPTRISTPTDSQPRFLDQVPKSLRVSTSGRRILLPPFSKLRLSCEPSPAQR
ncbi:glycoside hydrolase family 79 protein [Collybiopsis luxurians FD-317 M1]|uniref:Glycoside hydrolase family 79 protein n=1 Tax=Collybiopsis luxurians FD-317 M1 TaxID=944289 RepID=A0A0D0CUI2_9AGAR|nr:glycoside hydrolase family 79 protein [Collybiopsis luxurians FD-317 M1]